MAFKATLALLGLMMLGSACAQVSGIGGKVTLTLYTGKELKGKKATYTYTIDSNKPTAFQVDDFKKETQWGFQLDDAVQSFTLQADESIASLVSVRMYQSQCWRQHVDAGNIVKEFKVGTHSWPSKTISAFAVLVNNPGFKFECKAAADATPASPVVATPSPAAKPTPAASPAKAAPSPAKTASPKKAAPKKTSPKKTSPRKAGSPKVAASPKAAPKPSPARG